MKGRTSSPSTSNLLGRNRIQSWKPRRRNVSVTAIKGPVTTTLPLRLIDVVTDSAITTSATGSSSSTTITLTGSGLPIAIPVGTDVAYVAGNGQIIQTGSFVTTAAAAAATSVTINAAIAVPGSVVAIPASSTIVFTQFPEVLVKFNQALHGYYSATGA